MEWSRSEIPFSQTERLRATMSTAGKLSHDSVVNDPCLLVSLTSLRPGLGATDMPRRAINPNLLLPVKRPTLEFPEPIPMNLSMCSGA